jgi:hypothetical protein
LQASEIACGNHDLRNTSKENRILRYAEEIVIFTYWKVLGVITIGEKGLLLAGLRIIYFKSTGSILNPCLQKKPLFYVIFIFQIVQRGKPTLSYGVEGLTRIVQRGCQLCGQPLSTQQKLNHGKVPLKSVHKFTCIVKWATQLPSPLLLRFKKDG